MLFGGANLAFAEESGGFVGFGIGGGNLKSDTNLNTDTGGAGDDINTTKKKNAGGVSYGFVGGYKQFFTPYLGLRYYANVDLTHADVVAGVVNMYGVGEPFYGKNSQAILLNYGVNVDFFGNFVVTEMVDFGGFIGFGIGGNTIMGKYVDDLKKIQSTFDLGAADIGAKITESKLQTTNVDVALNVGLRTNIAKYHGVELAVRVPFIKITTLGVTMEMGGGKMTTKSTISQNVRVLARYTFSF